MILLTSGYAYHHFTPITRIECLHRERYRALRWSLQWRHNERDGVSNHRRFHLLNRMFRGRSTKTSKLRVTGPCEGNSPVTGELLAQEASNVFFYFGPLLMPICVIIHQHFVQSWYDHEQSSQHPTLAPWNGAADYTLHVLARQDVNIWHHIRTAFNYFVPYTSTLPELEVISYEYGHLISYELHVNFMRNYLIIRVYFLRTSFVWSSCEVHMNRKFLLHMYFKWSSCELHMKFICNYVWNIEVAMIFICLSFEVHMTHRPELSNEISYEWYEPSVVSYRSWR